MNILSHVSKRRMHDLDRTVLDAAKSLEARFPDGIKASWKNHRLYIEAGEQEAEYLAFGGRHGKIDYHWLLALPTADAFGGEMWQRLVREAREDIEANHESIEEDVDLRIVERRDYECHDIRPFYDASWLGINPPGLFMTGRANTASFPYVLQRTQQLRDDAIGFLLSNVRGVTMPEKDDGEP